MEQPNYTLLSLDELQQLAKKEKQNMLFSMLLIGILIGISIWSATHKGGFFKLMLFYACIFLLFNNSRKNKEKLIKIKEEIARRNP
jgi:uncharacterized membrane protein